MKPNHQIDWVFDSSKCFSNNQIQELKDQMQQMFQLTLQNYVIESELGSQDEKSFWKEQLVPNFNLEQSCSTARSWIDYSGGKFSI